MLTGPKDDPEGGKWNKLPRRGDQPQRDALSKELSEVKDMLTKEREAMGRRRSVLVGALSTLRRCRAEIDLYHVNSDRPAYDLSYRLGCDYAGNRNIIVNCIEELEREVAK